MQNRKLFYKNCKVDSWSDYCRRWTEANTMGNTMGMSCQRNVWTLQGQEDCWKDCWILLLVRNGPASWRSCKSALKPACMYMYNSLHAYMHKTVHAWDILDIYWSLFSYAKGGTLWHLPETEEAGHSQAWAAPHSCEVHLVPSGHWFCWPPKSSIWWRQSLHSDSNRLLYEVHLCTGRKKEKL